MGVDGVVHVPVREGKRVRKSSRSKRTFEESSVARRFVKTERGEGRAWVKMMDDDDAKMAERGRRKGVEIGRSELETGRRSGSLAASQSWVF